MAETFQLSILLTAKDNASKEINGLLKQLSALDKKAEKTADSFEQMQGKVGKSFQSSQKGLEGYTRQTEKHSKVIGRLANLNEKYIEPAKQIGNVWKSQYDSLKVYTDEAGKFYRQQAKFRLLNLSESDNQKAFNAVGQITKNIKGATLTEATEDITDLYGALGDLNTAISAMPLATKFRVNFKALYGDEMDDAEIGKQIQNSFKFLELIGTTSKGLDETKNKLNTLVKISSSTGGRVTSADLLSMARRGGASVTGLSDDGLKTVSTLIEELGGDRTGTSLMSMYQALVGGKMKKSEAQRFADLGLVDESKVEYGKGGKVKSILPGGNVLGKLMQEDPLKAADALAKAMEAKGINTSDTRKVNEELAGLFGNRTAQQMMSLLINNRSQVEKEVKKATDAMGLDEIDDVAKEAKGIQEFEAAIKNFKVEAGIPLLKIGTEFAQMATPILKFFGEHPTLTQFAMGAMLAGKGLSAIAQTASILKSSGLGSVFSSLTSQANNATAAIGGTTSKATGLKGALSKISNSPIGITLSVVGIIGLYEIIKAELDLIASAAKSQADARNAVQENANAWFSYKKELDSQGKQPTQKDIDFEASSTWFAIMKGGLDSTLSSELSKKPFHEQYSIGATATTLYPVAKYYGAENKFKDGWGTGYNAKSLGKGFGEYGKSLNDPSIMVSLLKQLPNLVKDKTERQNVEEGLKSQFPESFTKAMAELGPQAASLSKSFLDLSQQANQQKQNGELINKQNQNIQTFSENLNNLSTPLSSAEKNISDLGNSANRVPSTLNNIAASANSAGNSLNGLSAKISSFKMPTPQVQTFSIGVPQQQSSVYSNPFLFPSRAIGGEVEADGYAKVHAGNVITPAKVSKGLNMQKFGGSSTGNITLNYSPKVQIDGGSETATADFQAMLNDHSKHIERLVSNAMGNGRARA